jgi:hypothetical protein
VNSNTRTYYDNDDLEYPRRDTFVSEAPTEGLYDNNSTYDPYGGANFLVFLGFFTYGVSAPHDTDSDVDVYAQRYATSAESLNAQRTGHTSSPTTFSEYTTGGTPDAYPAWSADRHIPLSKEEIEDIFLDLTQKFGFQRDSMRNMVSAAGFFFLFQCRYRTTSDSISIGSERCGGHKEDAAARERRSYSFREWHRRMRIVWWMRVRIVVCWCWTKAGPSCALCALCWA